MNVGLNKMEYFLPVPWRYELNRCKKKNSPGMIERLYSHVSFNSLKNENYD